MASAAEPLRLRTLLATYPHTAPLKNGEVASPRVTLDFKDVTPVWSGFKAMVRHSVFDVAEMAVVTYLIAKSFGKPMVLLPAVMTGRIQHAWAIYNGERGSLTPADLHGKKVGIRSFTTTTGAWLRGILANDYGVDLASIDWVTFEDAHVGEYKDATKRAGAGKEIVQMLLDGELDAVLGEKVEHPDLKPLFHDAGAEEKSWFAKHKVLPINHMVVVSQNLSERHPDAVREVHRLLAESADVSAASPRLAPDDMRRSLELITHYSAQQNLIPRAFTVDELFDNVTRALI